MLAKTPVGSCLTLRTAIAERKMGYFGHIMRHPVPMLGEEHCGRNGGQ